MATTLEDVVKALGFKDGDQVVDSHAYGEVKSINTDGTYQVSLNGSDTTVKCARLTGAKVGDTVLVLILSNGYAVATGCVGGDTDALDALTKAETAEEVATNLNQYFWYQETGTDNGAHVTQVPQEEFIENPTGGNTLITSNGLAVREGLTELATFTNNAVTIGQSGKSQAVLGSASFSVTGNGDTDPFFVAEDLRGGGTTATLTEQGYLYSGDDTFTTAFSIRRVDTVTLDGTATTNYSFSGNAVILDSAVTDTTLVKVTYVTVSDEAKALTFGARNSTGSVGGLSVSFGDNNTASGARAFTVGTNNVASGENAVALGQKLTVTNRNQVAVGYYNETPSADDIFIVGAGADYTAHDVFKVDKNGNATIGYFDNILSSNKGGLTVNGGATFNADVAIEGTNGGTSSLDISGNLEVGSALGGGDITAYGNMTVGDMASGGGNITIDNVGKGVYLKDSAYQNYGGIVDNGQNLWIGAEKSATTHHTGGTYISSGHDGTAGNETIYISVPNANNNNATNYPVYHGGYKPTKTLRQTYSNVAITNRSGNGAYYSANLTRPSGIPTNATILSVMVSGFSGASASFTPSLNGNALMLMSDISQTVTTAGLLFAYQV